jgi:hypothetical protein
MGMNVPLYYSKYMTKVKMPLDLFLPFPYPAGMMNALASSNDRLLSSEPYLF